MTTYFLISRVRAIRNQTCQLQKCLTQVTEQSRALCLELFRVFFRWTCIWQLVTWFCSIQTNASKTCQCSCLLIFVVKLVTFGRITLEASCLNTLKLVFSVRSVVSHTGKHPTRARLSSALERLVWRFSVVQPLWNTFGDWSGFTILF